MATSAGKTIIHDALPHPPHERFEGAVFPAVVKDIRRSKFGDLEITLSVPQARISYAMSILYCVVPIVVSAIPWNPAEIAFDEAAMDTGDSDTGTDSDTNGS